jgi:hypothetical protein
MKNVDRAEQANYDDERIHYRKYHAVIRNQPVQALKCEFDYHFRAVYSGGGIFFAHISKTRK